MSKVLHCCRRITHLLYIHETDAHGETTEREGTASLQLQQYSAEV